MPVSVTPTAGNQFKGKYHLKGKQLRWYSDGSVERYYMSSYPNSYGVNYSTGHKRDKDGVYRSGGSWLMWKFDDKRWGDVLSMHRQNYAIPAYVGMQHPDAYAWAFPVRTENQLWLSAFNRGAEAYAALKPDLPDFSAASNLYELKDTFHELKGRVHDMRNKTTRRMARLRSHGRRFGGLTAELYIAYSFGWKPLFRDIRNFVEAFNGRKLRFDQLLRDEGKSVRRSRTLSGSANKGRSNSSETVTVHPNPWNPYIGPTLVTQCYSPGQARTTRVQGSSSHVWCEGKSRYLLPPGPRDDQWKKKISRRILGAVLSPNQVWNIIPWSWAADYFTGIGHFLDSVSPGVADRVWFEYAYVMATENYWDKSTYEFHYYSSKSGAARGTSFMQISRTSKVRSPATPFGWGLATPSLHQMSILGALGYSRLPDRGYQASTYRL